MASDIVRRKPQRMSFTNLENLITLEAQFNPRELDEDLKVNWGELAVPGLSHKPQQYSGTDNHSFSFRLDFAAIDREGNKLSDITYARRFLLSLAYSRRDAQSIVNGSPPRFLFIWPNFISLTCVLHSAKLKHYQFGLDGQPTNFYADMQIKEIRDVRLYGEDVFFDGTFRNGTLASNFGDA